MSRRAQGSQEQPKKTSSSAQGPFKSGGTAFAPVPEGKASLMTKTRAYVGDAAKAVGTKGAILLTFTGFHLLSVTPFFHPWDGCYEHLL